MLPGLGAKLEVVGCGLLVSVCWAAWAFNHNIFLTEDGYIVWPNKWANHSESSKGENCLEGWGREVEFSNFYRPCKRKVKETFWYFDVDTLPHHRLFWIRADPEMTLSHSCINCIHMAASSLSSTFHSHVMCHISCFHIFHVCIVILLVVCDVARYICSPQLLNNFLKS